MRSTKTRNALAIALVALLVGGVMVALGAVGGNSRTHVTAYFDNSNGIFVGDDVYMLGVAIGEITSIDPQPQRAKIDFWFDNKYQVPADAKAVILSPQLITSRAIQLTPAYTGGPALADGAVIDLKRTAVPVEWDDFRNQLEKLSSSLQPDQNGNSPLGSFINTSADNLRGQGADIRQAIIQMSQAFSALGDHSNDIFSTMKNLSILVQGLQSSTEIMQDLNINLASTTSLLANSSDQIGSAVDGLNSAAQDVAAFVADNREALGTTSDKLSSVTTTLNDSRDTIKQILHVAPTAVQNFLNIYEPSHASLTGALVVNNFANPITFLCGAIQAASRLHAEQSAKLCAQYLAPIIKNRQYNFPPIGINPFVNASARPNEVTYSEDWMRPDYQPPAPPVAAEGPGSPQTDALAAEAPPPPPPPAEAVPTDPTAGLIGIMVPPGMGS